MPLTPEDRYDIAHTATAMLGYYKGSLTNPEIGQRIARRYSGLTNSDRATILATVNQQKQIFDRGLDLMDPANANVPSKPGVTDWALLNSPYQYGWRVEVQAVNAVTGDRIAHIIEVTSPTPLTPTEIRQQALDYYQRDTTVGGRYPELAGVISQYQLSTTILTAGKNPL